MTTVWTEFQPQMSMFAEKGPQAFPEPQQLAKKVAKTLRDGLTQWNPEEGEAAEKATNAAMNLLTENLNLTDLAALVAWRSLMSHTVEQVEERTGLYLKGLIDERITDEVLANAAVERADEIPACVQTRFIKRADGSRELQVMIHPVNGPEAWVKRDPDGGITWSSPPEPSLEGMTEKSPHGRREKAQRTGGTSTG